MHFLMVFALHAMTRIFCECSEAHPQRRRTDFREVR